MNRRLVIVMIGGVSILAFAIAGITYYRLSSGVRAPLSSESTALVRPHSPVLGPANARVTIVEFFDPACETCRAMYPVLKRIMADYPADVRVVVRYAPFHKGSEEAVRLLETARKQGVYVPVKEALLATQPQWADHGRPRIELAWLAAEKAGLDVASARQGMQAPEISAILSQDMNDIRELGVRQTPTFFVNGKPLPSFGVRQLVELVRSEIDAVRRK